MKVNKLTKRALARDGQSAIQMKAKTSGGAASTEIGNSGRMVLQRAKINGMGAKVMQMEWGDDHDLATILNKLTGKNLADFKNHRGEEFDSIRLSQSANGPALILDKAGSNAHFTIPYTKDTAGKKYVQRGVPHLTGLFNSGTAEEPELQEFEQSHDLAGTPTADSVKRPTKYVRRDSLKDDDGKPTGFLSSGKIRSDGLRQPNARGENGKKFIRVPSSGSLNLTESELPKKD